MEIEIRKTSDMSDYEISSIVNWQVWEILKGKKCVVCRKDFTIQDKNAVCAGKDKNGDLLAAHEYCYNKN